MIKLVACDVAGTTIDEHGDVYVALAGAVEETGASTTDEDVQETPPMTSWPQSGQALRGRIQPVLGYRRFSDTMGA